MPGIFERIEIGTEHHTESAGFVVVRLQASPENRAVVAHGYIDNELIASASASDNYENNVISNPVATFTMPVPKGSRFKVVVATGTGVEVRWFPR